MSRSFQRADPYLPDTDVSGSDGCAYEEVYESNSEVALDEVVTEYLTTGVTSFVGVNDVVHHMAQWLPPKDALRASSVNQTWRQSILVDEVPDISDAPQLYQVEMLGRDAVEDIRRGRHVVSLPYNLLLRWLPHIVSVLSFLLVLSPLMVLKTPFHNGALLVAVALSVYVSCITAVSCGTRKVQVALFLPPVCCAIHVTNFLFLVLCVEVRSHLLLPTYRAEDLSHSMLGSHRDGPFDLSRTPLTQAGPPLSASFSADDSYFIDFGHGDLRTSWTFGWARLPAYESISNTSMWPYSDWRLYLGAYNLHLFPKQIPVLYRRGVSAVGVFNYSVLFLRVHDYHKAPWHHRGCRFGFTPPRGRYLVIQREQRLFFRPGNALDNILRHQTQGRDYDEPGYYDDFWTPRLSKHGTTVTLPTYADYDRTGSGGACLSQDCECEVTPSFQAWEGWTSTGITVFLSSWLLFSSVLALVFPSVLLRRWIDVKSWSIAMAGYEAHLALESLRRSYEKWCSVRSEGSNSSPTTD